LFLLFFIFFAHNELTKCVEKAAAREVNILFIFANGNQFNTTYGVLLQSSKIFYIFHGLKLLVSQKPLTSHNPSKSPKSVHQRKKVTHSGA